MGPVARWNFTLDVTGQPCCLLHSFPWVRPHTGRKLRGLLNQMQNISYTQKAKFRVFGFKSDTAVLTLNFLSFCSPLFSLFLTYFFFSCWVFSRLHFVGKVWRKSFSILGLNESRGRWVVEKDFDGNFRVTVTRSFTFFSGVLDWIVLILVRLERSLHSAQV